MLGGTAHQALQRSFGEVDLAVDSASAYAVKIRQMRQIGCAKVFLPKGSCPEAVFLNTAGGLTGGDQLSFSLKVGDNSDFTASTQTAERVYATSGGAASVKVKMAVGAMATLSWLPQETILYERSHLRRRTDVFLAHGASVLSCEMIVLGRQAMDEHPKDLHLEDVRRFYVADRLVHSEAIRIEPETITRQSGGALLRDARCFASLVMIGQGAEAMAAALDPILSCEDCDAAASAWGGKLILRVRARHSWPMRKKVAEILTQLRRGPLPRVWQMNGDIL